MGMSAFASALRNTAEKSVTGPMLIYFVTDYSNYRTLYYATRGKPMSQLLDGGSALRWTSKFKTSSKAGYYDPATEDHAPQNSQDSVVGRSYWHTHMAHETWNESQLLVNQGGVSDSSLIEETYAQEIQNKMQSLHGALANSFGETMWQQPDNTLMGQQDLKQPNSIPVYLNQFSSGLFGRLTAAGAYIDATKGFTAIHGFSPQTADHAKYVPYTAGYGTGSTGFTANNAQNLIYYLSLAMRKTDFGPPPFYTEDFDPESDTAVDRSGGVIFCSAIGLARAEHLYRSSQNRWDDFMDPAGNPRFKTVQLVHEAQLDAAKLYPNHATLASATDYVDENAIGSAGTEVTNADKGPRYYGVNFKYTKFIWHSASYLKYLDPFRQNLETWTQGVRSMTTMQMRDRSKSFLLYPISDQ
jgi:hypothetical protein